jgi:hypothetical protein
MPLLDQIREKALIKLARTRFESDPTPAEFKVLRDSASSLDPDVPDADATRPTIRPEFVRWLATDPEAAPHIDPKGLRVDAATIPGKLDLRECHVNPALTFFRCDFQGEIDLESAETRGIYVLDSSLAGGIRAEEVSVHGSLFLQRIHSEGEIRLLGARIEGVLHCSGAKLKATGNALIADGAKIDGGVFLNNGFESEGAIRLLGAEITGNLECHGAKLNAKGDALIVDNAKIGGDVFLRNGFESEGEIRLLGAKITGQLVCDGARLKATGNALIADGAKISNGVFLTDGFESEGTIRLRGAEITGPLVCNGAKLKTTGNALHADSAKIGGGVFMKEGFQSEGKISLLRAEITGPLNCIGAKLKAKGDALSADGAKIGGGVFLTYGFESSGTIRLLGAQIKGNLECNGAKLYVAEGNALFADGAVIGGDIFLCKGFESSGEIRLLGAKIKGDLACADAKLSAKKGVALNADSAEIGGYVSLRNGFECNGEIRLLGAQIGRDLSIFGAKVARVLCQNTVVKGDLIWLRIGKSEETSLNLAGASVKNLHDDRESWLDKGKMDLDGLVYEELTLHEPLTEEQIKASMFAPEFPMVAKERIDWIMLQPEDRRTEPQPWMQLRELLERRGDRKGAKHVHFRFRCLQAQGGWTLWRWLRIAFAWLEEDLLRILLPISCTVALGTLVFAGAARSVAMIETVQTQPAMIATYSESAKGVPRKPDESNKPVSVHYTSFQPFIYTLENAVPLAKLGMDERWMPDLQHQPQPWFPRHPWLDGLKWFNSYGFLVWSRWALILSGWVQATVLAAALADRFKK